MASTKFEPAAVGIRGGDRVARIVRASVATFNRWYRRRMAARYLQTVDERILRDIGINRSDILSAVYGARIRGGRFDAGH